MASEISDIQVFHHLKRNNEENMLKVVSFLSLSLSLLFVHIEKEIRITRPHVTGP
jgi:hypothetical protein